MHNKEAICEIKLAVPGRHNAGNAMAAIALACTMGINTDAIIRGLTLSTVPTAVSSTKEP